MAFPLLSDKPAIRERALPLSVEQYYALADAGKISENVELLEGVIVEKMPPSSPHSATVQRLMKVLRAAVDDSRDVRQEQPINTRDSAPEPDLAVVPARADEYYDGHPTTAELVIEVAISSRGFDYQKRSIYAAAGVGEYWIVLPERRRVEVYTGPEEDGYANCQVYTPPQKVASTTLPAFQLDLEAFFSR